MRGERLCGNDPACDPAIYSVFRKEIFGWFAGDCSRPRWTRKLKIVRNDECGSLAVGILDSWILGSGQGNITGWLGDENPRMFTVEGNNLSPADDKE